jgi:putative ABC transport system permease protein
MLFVLGLNDVFSRPFRSFLTGLNLTLGVIGIVFGLALNETLDAYIADPTLLGIVYDALVTREETSDGRTKHLLRTAPGVEAFYGEDLVDVKTLNGQSFQVRAVEGNLAAFPLRISEGRIFQPNVYEAIAGQGLLDWLGLRVGDEITLILEDEEIRPVTWQIVGQYAESSNAGQMLMVNMSSIARYIRPIKPSTYYLKLSPDFNVAQLKQHLDPSRDADLTLNLVDKAIPWSVLYLQIGIFALAIILIAIALINVFNTALLSVQEKLRSIGVLKTLGMTPTQVVTMVNTSTGFLGLLATGAGVPLGLALTQGILATLSQSYGVGVVNVNLNFLHILFLIPIMVGISMVGSLIPARQAAQVSIVQVLRNE